MVIDQRRQTCHTRVWNLHGPKIRYGQVGATDADEDLR